MNYSIIVKISKYEISFWQQNGNSHCEPLAMKEGNVIPLYFYINGSDFIMGKIARERSNANDPNAYGDYFSLITDPSKYFTIHGDSKPVKQLIYYGIENYLSHFIKTVLYKNDSIEGYRQNFCLRFWFDSDLEEKEKRLIETIFNEAGYDNAVRIDYYQSLFESISSRKTIINGSPLILLTSIDNCLYVNYFNFPQTDIISFRKLEGQGSDPRVKILASLILEDIKETLVQLRFDKDEELAYIIPSVVEFLKKSSNTIEGEVLFTSGKKYDFKVYSRDIESRLTYDQGFSKINSVISEVITENNINTKELNIFIIGDQINTSYLIAKIANKFSDSKILGIEKNIIDSSISFLFNQILDSGYKIKSKQSHISVKHTVAIPNISSGSTPIVNPTKISAPPIQKSEIVPPVKLTPPPIPTGLKPQLPPSAKLPNTPPVRLTQTPIPTGAKPQLPPSVKQPHMPPIQAEPPQMPNGLKPPVVSSKSLGPPPVPINLQPPPVPKGLKLPPPPPPKTPKIKSKKK